MEKRFIRAWNELDVEDVSRHLMIIGELVATCNNCQALGLDQKLKTCPQCNTEFRYATFSSSSHNASQFNKIRDRKAEIMFIDYGDFKKGIGEIKAKKFFK